MKNSLIAFLFLLAVSRSEAAVVNVEFNFTPFLGDPATDEKVTSIPGKAQVFINGVSLAEQEVREQEFPVLFDDREVAPAVWATMAHVGPMVRKGTNKIRIEFTPSDTAKVYRAQLRWASVMDETTEEGDNGRGRMTNQANEGVENRQDLKGKVVFEREFEGDFAPDRPWHHYPAVTSVTDSDKQAIAALLKKRAEWFKPDFSDFYNAIAKNEAISVANVRKARCLEAAYKAGVRIPAPNASELEFTPSSGPEVVVTRKTGMLFPLDEKTLAPIKSEDAKMCAGMALSMAYPKQLAAVRTTDGIWEIAY